MGHDEALQRVAIVYKDRKEYRVLEPADGQRLNGWTMRLFGNGTLAPSALNWKRTAVKER